MKPKIPWNVMFVMLLIYTGCYNGIIAICEQELGMKRQWSICQLHGNECPMRHVFQYLGGSQGTLGPKSFRGLIVQDFSNGDCHLRDTLTFVAIDTPELPILIEVVEVD